MAHNLLLPFSSVSKDDIHIAGHKGVVLGELVKAKIPIPDGFIVTTSAYSEFFREGNLFEKVQHIITLIDFTDKRTISHGSEQIKKIICNTSFSEDLAIEVFKSYSRLGDSLHDTPVTLIPSLTQKSIQNLFQDKSTQGEANLLVTIRDIWASFFDSSILSQVHEKNIDYKKDSMAIIIQKSYSFGKSGRLYTTEPFSKNKTKTLIKAHYGMPSNSELDGKEDVYLVDKLSHSLIDKKITKQTEMYSKNGQDENKTQVPKSKASLQKLNLEEIEELSVTAEKIEKLLYFPQEVTWGIENEKTYILQINQLDFDIFQSSYAKPLLPTATQLYINITKEEDPHNVAVAPADGVGFLDGSWIIKQMGIHPKELIQKKKEKEMTEKIADVIENYCKAFIPRPVIYSFSNLNSSEHLLLKESKLHETREQNPHLGYRGALRYTTNPELLHIELEAIKRVRNKAGLKNIWLMLPFVRTIKELEEMKKIISSTEVYRSPTLKIWLSLDLPSSALLIEDFLKIGIDGVSLNLDHMASFLLGVDFKNPEISHLYQKDDPSLLWILDFVLKF